MQADSIVRALKSREPQEREAGARLLLRGLRERHGLCCRLLRGCDRSITADDLLARVLEKVVTCIDQYEERGAFWGWVHRILLNEAHDLRRQEPAIPRTPVVAANAPFLCAVHQMLARTGTATRRGRILPAFRSLSRRDQKLLKYTARRWPERTPDRDIARLLRIPERLVRGYRHRALGRFRKALEGFRGQEDSMGSAEEST